MSEALAKAGSTRPSVAKPAAGSPLPAHLSTTAFGGATASPDDFVSGTNGGSR
jgi:hypothetical protein